MTSSTAPAVAISQAKQCEQHLKSVAVELAYIITAPPSQELADFAVKILQRAIDPLSNVPALKWSTVVEELVNNIKLCMYSFELQGQMGRLSGVQNAPQVDMTSSPQVLKLALEILLGLTKVLRGKEAFSLYQAVLLQDYPPGFHFLDMLHPNIASVTDAPTKVDPCLMLKLVKCLVVTSRNALVHAESACVGSRAYVSASQSMANSLEEIILCLIKLYQSPGNLKHDLVHQTLISCLEVVPLPKLSTDLLERLNTFVLNLFRHQSTSLDRAPAWNIVVVLIKTEYPLSHSLVQDLLAANMVEHCIDKIAEFVTKCEQSSGACKSFGPIVELELLTKLVESYLIEFKPVSIRCLEVILGLLGKSCAFESKSLDASHKTNGIGEPKHTSASKPFVYDIDKIGKLVRVYNPGKKCLDGVAEKMRSGVLQLHMLVFRQALQFVEALVHSVGKDTDKHQDLVPALINNLERFLEMLSTLINCKTLFVGQGALDCLAAMSSQLFSQLSDETQQKCLDIFLKYSKYHEIPIRVKAGRCLAIYLEFDDVAQAEPDYLMSALDKIDQNLDGYESEQGDMFSWAFGNFTGILAKHYQGDFFVPANPTIFLMQLERMAFKCFHSKTFHNSFRALGNILLWTPNIYLTNEYFMGFLEKAIGRLTMQVGHGRDYKARWNACYAIGNVLKNSALVEAKHREFVPDVLNAVSTCLVKTDSFKEKFHCLNALQKIEKREYYGDMLENLWYNLFWTIEEHHYAVEPTRDTGAQMDELHYRVGQCGAHFIKLMTKTDFVAWNEFLFEHSDSFRTIFNKLRDEVKVLEQLATVDAALHHITEFSKEDRDFGRLESVEMLVGLLDTSISTPV